MNKTILSATKNISRTFTGFAVIISLYYSDDSQEKVTYEEDNAHTILTHHPIKWLRKDENGNKGVMKSYSEHSLTNELLMKVDVVVSKFDEFQGEKKVLL